MSLTCPRCKTDVTNETLYCSYCSLPKPRGGFAAAEEASPEQTKRIEQPKPPVGFKSSKKEQKRSSPPPIKARGTTNVKARAFSIGASEVGDRAERV